MSPVEAMILAGADSIPSARIQCTVRPVNLPPSKSSSHSSTGPVMTTATFPDGIGPPPAIRKMMQGQKVVWETPCFGASSQPTAQNSQSGLLLGGGSYPSPYGIQPLSMSQQSTHQNASQSIAIAVPSLHSLPSVSVFSTSEDRHIAKRSRRGGEEEGVGEGGRGQFGVFKDRNNRWLAVVRVRTPILVRVSSTSSGSSKGGGLGEESFHIVGRFLSEKEATEAYLQVYMMLLWMVVVCC